MKAFPILLLMIFITFVSSSENKNKLTSFSALVREHHMNAMFSAKDMFKMSQTSKNAYDMYHKLAVQTYFKEHMYINLKMQYHDFTEFLSQFEKQNLSFTITFPYNEYKNDKNNRMLSVKAGFLEYSFFRMRFHNTDGSVIEAEMAFNDRVKFDGANLTYYRYKNSIFDKNKCDEGGSFTIRFFPQNYRYIVESTIDNHKYSMDFEYQEIEIYMNAAGQNLSQGIFNSLNFDWEL